MIAVAQWVANLPGAVGHIAAFGVGPLLLSSAGLLLLCLLRTRLRWSGAALVMLASIWAAITPQPDVYIAGDGQTAAVRGTDGRLSVLRSGRDTFAIKEWLAADADARTVTDKTLASGTVCDDIGCVAQLYDGHLVAMPLAIDAFAEDCARAAVVVSARSVPSRECPGLLFDRDVLRDRGAVSLRIRGGRIEISQARPPGYQRPWAEPIKRAATKPAPEATPALNQLEPGD
jgi:competence protein ComEC